MVVREANIFQEPKKKPKSRFRQKALILATRFLYSKVDCIVANSPDTLKSLEKLGLNFVIPTSIIGNPIVFADFNDGAQFLGWLPQPLPPFLCAVGRLVHQKGFDTLIAAFARLPNKQIHLVILGEGNLRTSLINQATELGVSARVHLPGFVKNPMAVVVRSCLFVLSSRWEGFGNVLVEALATGVPIVATDCPGGPSWILEDGAHGQLVSIEDPDALTSAIMDGLHRPAGTRAARIARARDFSADQIAREYLAKALLPPTE